MSKKVGEKRIMAFGTFDGLHPGHLHFFRQARALAANPFLIVSVARDQNVNRIKNKKPGMGERLRRVLVQKTGLADLVVLSGLRDHIPHILKAKPDIIALGYDQKDYIKNLKKDLRARGLAVKIVRLKPYKPHIYKNALLRGKRASI